MGIIWASVAICFIWLNVLNCLLKLVSRRFYIDRTRLDTDSNQFGYEYWCSNTEYHGSSCWDMSKMLFEICIVRTPNRIGLPAMDIGYEYKSSLQFA